MKIIKQYTAIVPMNLYTSAVMSTEEGAFGTNFRMIDPNNAKGKLNRTTSFYMASSATWTGLPPSMPVSQVTGFREVYYRSLSAIMIKITELMPIPGRQYFAMYNGSTETWSSWKTITPS